MPEYLIKAQHNLLRSLETAHELQEALRLCLIAAFEASGLDSGGIYLIDESGNLNLTYSSGLSDTFVTEVGHYPVDSPHARMVQAGTPVYTRHQKMPFPVGENEKREELRAIAVIPIRYEEQVVGSLNVASHHVYKISLRSRMLLESIASITGLLIIRSRTDNALRENKERMQLLIEHAPVALALLDHNMRYLAASNRWLEDYRLGDRNIVGQLHYDIFPEIPDTWRAVYQRGLQGETIHSDEEPFVRLDDSNQWLRWEVRPWHTGDGAIGGIVIFTEDISDRKRAELVLEEREAQYRAVIETAADGFWMLDQEGRLIAVNDTYVKRSGFKREELLSMGIADLEARESPDEVLSHIEKVRREGSDLFETLHRTKNGEIWPVEVNASFSATAGGLLFAFCRDITDRKCGEQALRESEDRYRSLFTHSPDAILVNQQNRVILVNEACLRLFGAQSADELIGKSPYDLIHQDYHPLLRDRVRRIRETAEPLPAIEEKIVRVDGTTVEVEVLAAPFPLAGTNAIHVILRDISQRRALEREIIEASTTEQERIGQDIHDGLGQQLTGLNMLAGSVEQHLVAAGHTREAQQVATLRSHLSATLEETRSLARGLSPVVIDPQGLADSLAELAVRITRTTGIDCRYIGSREVLIDEGFPAIHLYRIAQEAVHNAVKHAEPKHIEISLDRDEEGLLLAIKDDGKGIDLAQDRHGRLGLHIMRYRAGILGCRFSVGPAMAGGTLVQCALRNKP